MSRRISQNTFNQGLKMDLNPLTTPNNILTDAVNATIITYNGNEFVLQNDMGNAKVDTARLHPGFIPMGMKEWGGIIYVASLNPITGDCQFGSFPSPQENFNPSDFPGLTPVEVQTSEFVLETNTTTETSTKFIGKLSIPELFQLAPGDLYVVTFDIHDPRGDPDDPKNIDTLDKMNDWISSDRNNRKLFFLQFYKITSNNNLIPLNINKVNVIENEDDISEDYKYFAENSKATLVVSLQFEQLDRFNATVVDTSLNVNVDKTVAIQASGFSDSLADFQGIKLEVLSPSTSTVYIDKATSTDSSNATISGLSAGDNFQCSITPYCDYCLFPKLRQDFKLTIGKYFSAGSGVNDIFQYYVDSVNKTVQVNFDFKFQGNSNSGLFLYIEAYDPWSNYSVVKTVDSPTYYGVNTVTFDLVDEPLIDQFDGTTVGGTNPLKLITNTDTTYRKTLLNSTSLIRTDDSLRKNSFYIIRISGVDKSIVSGSIVYTHYDFYKGLYTNDMFNDVFTSQAGLASTDPSYISDFNSLDFDISTIHYNTNIELTNSTNISPVETLSRSDLMTDGNYYVISPTTLDTTVGYKYTQTFENKGLYNVSMTLDGTERIFGDFKNNLVSLTPPTLQNSDGTDLSAQKPIIVDIHYDNNTNIPPNSLANWSITNVSGTNYVLTTDTFTDRSIFSDIVEQTTTASTYLEVPLASSFYYRPNGDGVFSFNNKAVLYIQKYNLQCMNTNGSTYTYILPSGASPYDGNVGLAINASINTSRTYSAILMTSGEPTWTYKGSVPAEYNACRDGGTSLWKKSSMVIKMADGTYRLAKVTDLDAMIQFFNSLFVTSNVSGTVYIYYPNSAISVNGDIQTVVTYPDMNFITNLTPNVSGMSYITTYLSTFRFRALNSVVDFSATNINNYITTRQSTSTIVDGKNSVRSGFIPFINTVHTSTIGIPVPQLTIDQAANSSVIDKFLAGQVQYTSDPIFREGPRSHGTLWTNIDAFAKYMGEMEPGNVFPNTTVVNTGSNAVYAQMVGSTPFLASGEFCRVGGCRSDNLGPSLIPSLDITKQ